MAASAGGASAQAPVTGTDKVAAESLFDEGRKLVASGKFAEACPKFADSERLDPSPGTLLNLANCWEKIGRTASAWATYREAASAANAAGRTDYVATAQRHAEALGPKLARLTLRVAATIDGLEIKRDGAVVSSAEWNSSIPVDPGAHTIEAHAPAHKDWTTTVAAQEGAQATVSIPALEPLPAEAAPAVSAPAVTAPPSSSPSAAAPAAVPSSEAPPPAGSGQRTAGIVVGAVGLAGLATAGVFAILAKAKDNDSRNDCPSNPNVCSPTGVSQRNEALTEGNVATVAVSVGAAALVGGAIVWLTAPRAQVTVGGTAATVSFVPTLGGASIAGAW